MYHAGMCKALLLQNARRALSCCRSVSVGRARQQQTILARIIHFDASPRNSRMCKYKSVHPTGRYNTTAVHYRLNSCIGTPARSFSDMSGAEEDGVKDLDFGAIKGKWDVDEAMYLSASDRDTEEIMKNDIVVLNNFITNEEENVLIEELHRYLRKLRYEFDHWDNAIHGFRETEKSNWSAETRPIIERIKATSFPPGSLHLSHVHVLDLAEDGHIKPHIDSSRFCGGTISGLSLMSPSVMRFVHDNNKSSTADVLLSQRSLYIMRGKVRYDYTHEILSNESSKFKDDLIHKSRRISVICRTEPSSTEE